MPDFVPEKKNTFYINEFFIYTKETQFLSEILK